MQDTKKYLGARIQELRKQQGLKQSELAELVDIDAKHMSKIECGRCFPSFELLDKIAFKLNTPISKFLETEHLHNRQELIANIIENLNKCSEEKFKLAYRIIKELF